jgi:hypothetical protein
MFVIYWHKSIDSWLSRIAHGQVPLACGPVQTRQDSAPHLLPCLGLKTDYTKLHCGEPA